MANIWFMRDGNSPTDGGPVAELDVAKFKERLGVGQQRFLNDLSTIPVFGQSDDPMATIRGYQHVVVEINEAEAKHHGWRPGFYKSPLSTQEASKRLGLAT